MIYRIVITIQLMLVCAIFFAQNEEDILRFSQTDIEGTARYASMGGAFGALGADITTLSVNPAGIGRFKSAIAVGTGNLGVGYTRASLNGTSNRSNSENLALNNLGIIGVINTRAENPSPWRKVQLGFAYNRLAEFNDDYTIKGRNDASYSFVLADRGFGLNPDQLFGADYHYASLAYENFLIDHVLDSGQNFYTVQMFDYNGEGITHEHSVNSKGRIGETAFSVGGNYADKLYLGATVGISSLRFSRTRTQFESANSDSLAIDNFTFKENLTTRGGGANLKLGVIILPKSWIRIGFAAHTSTIYTSVRDTWNNEIVTNFKNGDSYSDETETSSYLYNLTTPGRLIGSLALIGKKIGLVSADVEFLNYGKGQLSNNRQSGDNYDFGFENTTAGLIYRPTINLGLGAEYKITNQILARVGYAVNGQALKTEFQELATPRKKFSAGIGFRSNAFFADLAVVNTRQDENYFIYDPQLIENTVQTKIWTSALLTIGITL